MKKLLAYIKALFLRVMPVAEPPSENRRFPWFIHDVLVAARSVASMRWIGILLLCTNVSAWAKALPPQADPQSPIAVSEQHTPANLADADKDGLADGLEAKMADAGPADRFEVIITFHGPADVQALQQQHGPFSIHRQFKLIPGLSGTLTATQIRALSHNPNVFRIEENAAVTAQLDIAQPAFGAEQARVNYGVTGQGVTLCIIDSGMDITHEQLDSKDAAFFLDTVNNAASVYDDYGHGTHVASIACGDGDGPSGQADRFRGVAPDADCIAAKVLDASGNGTEADVIAGIEWCAGYTAGSPQNVDILNLSLGGGTSDGQDAMSQAVDAAVAAGKIVVAAAGNGGDIPGSVQIPCVADGAICVGSVAEWQFTDEPWDVNVSNGIYPAPTSSRGPRSDNVIKPDVMGPGVSIGAACTDTAVFNCNNDPYGVLSGTSMASPYVAGGLALAVEMARRPSNTPTEPLPDYLRQRLQDTALDVGAPGPDNEYGYGLVDILALVGQTNGEGSDAPIVNQPTQVHLSNQSVADGGLWTYSFDLSQDDLNVPIAATMLAEGTLECVQYFWIFCLTYQWLPDLEMRILDPNNQPVCESYCPAIGECSLGRQETCMGEPTMAGTYRVEVWPSNDSVNNNQGGPFSLDLSAAPVAVSEPSNGAPMFTSNPIIEANASENAAYSGTIADDASDPEGDPLTFSKVSGPAWLSVATDGSLGGTPGAGDVSPDPNSFEVQVQDPSGDSDTATLQITVDLAPAPADWTELTFDDFESGWGNWRDGGSDAMLSSSYAIGSRSLNLQDNSSSSYSEWISSRDLTGYSELKIEFSYVVRSFENSEDFWVRYSANGGASWTMVRAYVNNVDFVDNGTRYDEVIIIDSGSFTFSDNVKIRFQCDASGNRDDVYIDNIRISAK